ncbi:MAG: PadR family transcriptional regulator [Halodesulfurarchaeum sp.]|nr:PadR family transcriptional regulator [Halodesulfurarchaeum sp.]
MSKGRRVAVTAARDLTAFQKNILRVLAEQPRYGLAIKRELEAYYDDEVNHGRLYPNLDDLVDAGFVEKSALDKRTNEYGLTEDGLEAVRDDLRWSLEHFLTDAERNEFVESILDDE